jgi:hypothetical protein
MDQEPADVSVPTLADAQHLGFAPCGILLRDKAKPSCHIACLLELPTVA